MRATTHAALFRSGNGIIDSDERMRWASETVGLFDVTWASHRKPASASALKAVHAAAYIDGLDALALQGGARLDPELVFDSEMWTAARSGAGALVAETLRARRTRGKAAAICLSRPGSHHAGPDYALGGCIINNLAVAARAALDAGARRVAILDFDVHHGNGTQDIFWDEPRVLTVSTHQYPFFPGSGAPSERGTSGMNVNIALEAGSSGGSFRAAYELACEAAVRHQPELVLFEAGLDAHVDDWTSDLAVTNEDYVKVGAMTATLLKATGAAGILELGGGYTEAAVRGGLKALLDGLGVKRC